MQFPSEWTTVEAISTNGLAALMGTTARATARMAHCGMLGEVWSDGKTMLFKMEDAQKIIDLPTADPKDLPPALIVKMGEPTPDEFDGERDWLGYHRKMTASQKKHAISRWWRVGKNLKKEDYVGKLLVASIGGVVAEVYRITDGQFHEGIGRISFSTEFTGPEDTDAAQWFGHRLLGSNNSTVENFLSNK